MKKTLSILLCVSLLLALLPVMLLPASAADSTDLWDSLGQFEKATDVSSLFDLAEQSHFEQNGNGSDTPDTEVFTYTTDTDYVYAGEGAMLIKPDELAGNAPYTTLVEGLSTTATYTVSFKVKAQNARLIFNLHATASDYEEGSSVAMVNFYVFNDDGSQNTQVVSFTDAGNGWYTCSFSFTGNGNTAWNRMRLRFSPVQATDCTDGYIAIDDLTLTETEHTEHTDTDGDGKCDYSVLDYTKGVTETKSNPFAHTCVKVCGAAVTTDVFAGLGSFDSSANGLFASTSTTATWTNAYDADGDTTSGGCIKLTGYAGMASSAYPSVDANKVYEIRFKLLTDDATDIRMNVGSSSISYYYTNFRLSSTVGLSMMCYTFGKEKRMCLGDFQLSGLMGKLLY